MSFKKNKYKVLRGAITPEVSEFIYTYFLNKRTAAKFLFDQKISRTSSLGSKATTWIKNEK